MLTLVANFLTDSQNTRVYMYNGASTYSGNGARNYQLGARYKTKSCGWYEVLLGCSEEHTTYNAVWTQGTGSAPRWVSYQVFNFAPQAVCPNELFACTL